MTRSPKVATQMKNKRLALMSSVFFIARSARLALWQLRQTWRLLSIVGVGMVAAVVLVCAIPLYSKVAMTTELRALLNVVPTTSIFSNATIVVDSETPKMDAHVLQNTGRQIDQEIRNDMGSYLSSPAQFTLQVEDLATTTTTFDIHGKPIIRTTGNRVRLFGSTMQQAASHLKLMAGRLPRTLSDDLEIAVTPVVARAFHFAIGSTLDIQVSFVNGIGERVGTRSLTLHVVGIFTPQNSIFWHGENFQCDPIGLFNSYCVGLASNDTLIAQLNEITNGLSSSKIAQHIPSGEGLENPPSANWYYSVDPSQIDYSNENDLASRVSIVLANLANNPTDPPYVDNTHAFSTIPDILGRYASHIGVVQIPITSLLLFVAGLTLFFVSMMTEVLVDRQAEAISILRSRGAGRLQIVSSLALQSVGIGLIAFLVGPLLAILAVQGIAIGIFGQGNTGALNLILRQPAAILQELSLYALVTVGIAILTMLFSIISTTPQSMLAARRESARSTHRPLWQRVNLDLIAAVIALTGYAFSLYEASPGILDTRVRVLVLPPLTLAGVVFLLLGVTLLFLRLFPFCLRLAAQLAVSNRSAAPVLALSQMARAPKQSIRMTMLLAFSIAFALFTLIFNASQEQRIVDVTNYEVGADFSGKLPSGLSDIQMASYQHIPGVRSATLVYSSTQSAVLNDENVPIQFLAVDASTFARTAIWTGQSSSQSLDSLMQQLLRRRHDALVNDYIPVIVDTAIWNTLDLRMGSPFSLTSDANSFDFVPIAEVEHIPTINDSTIANGTSGSEVFGGILADLQSYLTVSHYAVAPTNVWLRTADNASSLNSVRTALQRGPLQLDQLNDRRAILDSLRNDPLYLDLQGVLILGTVTTLLLALLGNLIASWLSVRTHLTNFAVLRALGTAPRQIASILAWEQSIIYVTALVLGGVFGIVLALLALPALVFTNVSVSGFNSDISNAEYYILQTVPPVRVVFPPLLAIVFALLALICVIALTMMVRIASKPSISQTLRLNED